MAKLFCGIESERTGKHQIGNKFLELKVYYGSRADPKLLTHILVRPTQDKPEFFQYNTVEPKAMILQKNPLEVLARP